MVRRTAKIDTDGKPLAIYGRLSRKKPTRKRGGRVVPDTETVDYQVGRLRSFAAEQGYPIAEHLIFKDNHRSAWKQKGAVRPAWLAMMAAAKRGEIAGILVYRLDRFARAPRDGEDLLDLAEDRGLIIDGVKSGKLNLTTAAGRAQFRDMVNKAAGESDLISERSREALAEIMREGKPMGPARCFGFESGGEDQRPAEVAIIREMASRALAGESFERLADDLNTRVDAEGKHVTTVRGYKWTGPNLGKMLGRHRYGGYVDHHGEIVGTMPGEPVLDPDTYDALQGMLTSRRRGRRPTGRFLLTGLVFCSKCKRPDTGDPLPMNGKTRTLADGTKVRDYRCSVQLGGCGRSIMAEPVEDIVGDHMVKLLSDRKHVAEVVAKDAYLNEARSTQEAKLQAVRNQVTALTVKWTSGELPDEAYDQGLARLNGRLAKLGEGLEDLAPSKAIKGYDAGKAWAKMTGEEKRAAIQYHGVRIAIGPQPKGQRWFTPDRVELS